MMLEVEGLDRGMPEEDMMELCHKGYGEFWPVQ